MRIGGLSSGIDTDSIIKELMNAQRMPLNKLHQDRTKLEWKRDAFRDMNKMLADFDRKIFDMKLSDTYNSKIITSTQEDAVRATGAAGAGNGTYTINVSQIATSAINVGDKINVNTEDTLHSQGISGPIEFTTYNKEGEAVHHSYEIGEKDKFADIIKRINDDKESPVRLTYDENADKVILEATRTGSYHPDGNEIVFDDNSAFANLFNLQQSGETGGQNAKFTYNGAYEVETQNNHYQLNGVTFQFLNVTEGNATLNVTNDIDHAVDRIKEFVEAYNEIVEKITASQREEIHRDFPPLTDEQKQEMSEREIELWEEKAKSGILKGETALSAGLAKMRSSWYSTVNNDGQFNILPDIGISTTSDYKNGGKLEIDEVKLREALAEDPESVQKLFSNNSEGEGRGLLNRLEDAVEGTIADVNLRAGRSTDTSLDSYALGKRMKDINDRITNFERRLEQVEARYWKQFSAMEQAVATMNNQSQMLMSSFYPGQM